MMNFVAILLTVVFSFAGAFAVPGVQESAEVAVEESAYEVTDYVPYTMGETGYVVDVPAGWGELDMMGAVETMRREEGVDENTLPVLYMGFNNEERTHLVWLMAWPADGPDTSFIDEEIASGILVPLPSTQEDVDTFLTDPRAEVTAAYVRTADYFLQFVAGQGDEDGSHREIIRHILLSFQMPS